jgi:type II secretory pathway component PulJ
MAKRHEPGLIGYHFGIAGQSWHALISPRTLLLGGLAAGLAILLLVAIQTRAPATLKVSLSHQAASRQLANGDQLNFFNAWVNNRTTGAIVCRLEAEDRHSRQSLQLKGQTHDIRLKPGENRKLDFVLVSPQNAHAWQVQFYLKDSSRILAQSQALITPSTD